MLARALARAGRAQRPAVSSAGSFVSQQRRRWAVPSVGSVVSRQCRQQTVLAKDSVSQRQCQPQAASATGGVSHEAAAAFAWNPVGFQLWAPDGAEADAAKCGICLALTPVAQTPLAASNGGSLGRVCVGCLVLQTLRDAERSQVSVACRALDLEWPVQASRSPPPNGGDRLRGSRSPAFACQLSGPSFLSSCALHPSKP